MKTSNRCAQPRVPAPAALLVLALGACASQLPANVPARLQPGLSEAFALKLAARGVQIYECRAKKDAAGYEWAFVAPDADLFDANGRPAGKHGAGPYWQAGDGSRVTGTVKERAEAPVAGAIPWLLLATKPSEAPGLLSKMTSVQRVNTAGGVAPTSRCSADTAGRTERIAYTADYNFFATR